MALNMIDPDTEALINVAKHVEGCFSWSGILIEMN